MKVRLYDGTELFYAPYKIRKQSDEYSYSQQSISDLLFKTYILMSCNTLQMFRKLLLPVILCKEKINFREK